MKRVLIVLGVLAILNLSFSAYLLFRIDRNDKVTLQIANFITNAVNQQK